MTSKKIFLTLLLCFMLVGAIGLVDAKKKNYDSLTQTIDIDSSFLGIKTGDISTITLNTPLNNKVGQGYQKVAEMTINFEKDYENVFKKMEFFDIKNGMKEFERDFDYKYLTYEDYPVDDYTCKKELSKNGSISNNCQVTGSHLETREKWLLLTKKNF